MNGAVGHDDDDVVFFKVQVGAKHLLATNIKFGTLEVLALATMVVDGLGVVELEHDAFALGVHMDDGEGGVGHATLRTHRKGLDDGLDAFVDVDVVSGHRAKDLGGERGKDVGLHAAAQTVSQDEGGEAVLNGAGHIVAA